MGDNVNLHESLQDSESNCSETLLNPLGHDDYDALSGVAVKAINYFFKILVKLITSDFNKHDTEIYL